MTERSELVDSVVSEAARADARWGPFASSHEGYGVLAEEVAELLVVIRLNRFDLIRREAIQVAAVALRLADSMDDPDTRKRSKP